MGCCCTKEEEGYSQPSNHKQRSPPPASNHNKNGKGRDFGGGTVGGNTENRLSAREAAAAAALKRQEGADTSVNQSDKKIAERRVKDELVGKIEAYYSKIHKDPPIGLSASSVDALRKHLDYIKTQAGGSA
mmetsp:Transcript_47465/g.60951  ORF Transcript_47465/g.60951 Transcript_47465/m.60951 type:complete len:131 (+) Transcript_47465:19-411(+)